MSFSEHFPPSTQTILAAQQTPPKRRRFLPREDSIIVISSSPEESPAIQRVIDPDDEQYFGPFLCTEPTPLPTTRRKSSTSAKQEKSIEVLDDEEFSKLVNGFRFSTPLSETSINTSLTAPRVPSITQKSNLSSFFQECKPSSSRPGKATATTTKQVKSTLATRVSVPLRKPSSDKRPSSKSTTSSTENTSFFTSWAAAQAPITRPASNKTKPRRKPAKKKDVEVVLLSPRTGQQSVRTRVMEVTRGRLGEKSEGGLWDACKRGLDGELYDSDGAIVFSQELREMEQIEVGEIEVFDVSADTSREETVPNATTGINCPKMGLHAGKVLEEIDVRQQTNASQRMEIAEEEKPARRRYPACQSVVDGMPVYSTFTITQLQVKLSLSRAEVQNEIRKFGFKASKSKPEMIKLLEECWKATNQKSPPPSPQRPNADLISTPLGGDNLPDVSSPALLLRLHSRISNTIQTDADQSMYLGILRYEPLVVEDLMEWLEERELAIPELVIRGWCDKEGVCCVSRESLNGGKRARY